MSSQGSQAKGQPRFGIKAADSPTPQSENAAPAVQAVAAVAPPGRERGRGGVGRRDV